MSTEKIPVLKFMRLEINILSISEHELSVTRVGFEIKGESDKPLIILRNSDDDKLESISSKSKLKSPHTIKSQVLVLSVRNFSSNNELNILKLLLGGL